MSKKPKNTPKGGDTPDHGKDSPNQAATATDGQGYLGQQVQEAKKLNAISTWATLIAFLALLGVGYNACLIDKQVREMQKQVAEMQTSNANSLEAFEDTERPWLSVEVAPGAAGLSFVNGKQAVLAVKVSIKNVGKSIAKDIQVNAKLFPTSPIMPIALGAARNEQALCSNPTAAPIGWFDLFPTDSPAEETEDVSALPPAISAKSVKYRGAEPRSFVGFYVVGCVTYRFSFGAEVHQTRFAYHLIGPPILLPDRRPLILPNKMPVMAGFQVGVSVPQKKLRLIKELLGRNDAN